MPYAAPGEIPAAAAGTPCSESLRLELETHNAVKPI